MAEDDRWQQHVVDLLGQQRICFLATSGRDGPETSMAPYALDHGSVLLHLSGLARHTVNIRQSRRIGLMVCASSEQASSLALARLSLQGNIEPLAKQQLDAARIVYLERIPDAAPLFSFADFCLYRFTPDAIQWIGGFGKARKVTAGQWDALSRTTAES